MTSPPLDLEKALAGEPVILCNGDKAYVREHDDLGIGVQYVKHKAVLIGYICKPSRRARCSWKIDGSFGDTPSQYDIVGMYQEKTLPSTNSDHSACTG